MPDGGGTGAALATIPSTCMSLLSAGDMMQACFKLTNALSMTFHCKVHCTAEHCVDCVVATRMPEAEQARTLSCCVPLSERNCMLLIAAPSPRIPCARVSAQLPAAPAAAAHSTACAPTGTLCAHLGMVSYVIEGCLNDSLAVQNSHRAMLAWLAKSNGRGLRAWWSPCGALRRVARQGGCMHRLRPDAQRTPWSPMRSAALLPTRPQQSRFQVLAPKRHARLLMAAEQATTLEVKLCEQLEPVNAGGRR